MKDDDDLTSAYLLGAYDGYKAWKDAVEFEAKVAVLLAQKNPITFPCPPEHCYVKESCAWCRLKAARIAVEAEMEHGKA